MNGDNVAALIARYEEAWARADGAAAAGVFAEDGVLTSPMYERYEGRGAIAGGQQRAYDGPMRATRIEITVQAARWLRPDVAIVFTHNCIRNNADGTCAFPDSYGMLVLDGGSGRVEVAAYHNMVPLVVPVGSSRSAA